MNKFQNEFVNTFKDLTFKPIRQGYRNAKEWCSKIGPYHSYPLDVFEILPAKDIDNSNNRIILDSFANMAMDEGLHGIWGSVLHGRDPLGIEVFSDGENTTFHFLIPPDNVNFMVHKIYGVFNGSTIRKAPKGDYLDIFDGSTTDVYNITLKDHPVMPYRMDLSPVANSIVDSLEHLNKGEFACIQILLQPLSYDWQTKLKLAYEQYKDSHVLPPFGTTLDIVVGWLEGVFQAIYNIMDFGKDKKKPQKVMNFETELDKLVRRKISSNGFRTTIKVTVQSKDPSRRSQISRTLSSSITQLGRYNTFLLKKLVLQDKALENFKTRSVTKGGFISCSHEAANLISQPFGEIRSNKLVRAFPKEVMPDSKISEGSLLIGHTLPYKNERKRVCMASKSFNEMNKSTIILAPPGYGKTTLLVNMGLQRIENGLGFMAADIADGSIITDFLSHCKPSYRNKGVLLDFTDRDKLPHLSLNMIQGSVESRADFFCEWFEQMLNLGNNAPRAKRYLKRYALSCLSDPNNGLFEFKLLLDGDMNMVNKTIRNLKVVNPALHYWWTTNYIKNKDKITSDLETIRYRLDEILENPVLRAVFTGDRYSINPREIMDSGKFLLINLSAGKVSKSVQQSIMSFIFLSFWSACLSREEVICRGKKPKSFGLLLDEPYTYIHKTDIIEEAVNKFRKYGVAMNIFMHGVDQIAKKSKDLWEEIMMSGPNLVLGFVSDRTRKAVRNSFTDLDDEGFAEIFSRVENRDDHYFIANMSFDSGKVDPFVFKTCAYPKQTYNIDGLQQQYRRVTAPLTSAKVDEIIFSKLHGMSVEQYRNSMGADTQWQNSEEVKQKEIVSGI